MEASVAHGDRAKSSRPARHAPVGLPLRTLGDERLAKLVKTGNDRAFETLYWRYQTQLQRYCRSLVGSEADTQDAVQTAMTNALLALRAGRRDAPVKPWLFRIVHNEAISLIRRRRPDQELAGEELIDTALPAARAAHEVAEERARLTALVEDLGELGERQRQALVLRELSGLSHEEIAATLQISVGVAKQTVLEARRSLAEFAEGRAMACDEIQALISDGDRRVLRARRVRAHLGDCPVCSAFAASISTRKRDLLALSPAVPAAAAAAPLLGALAQVGAGGGAAAGTAAGTASAGAGALGAASKVGLGAALSLKTVAGGAALIVAAAGTAGIVHEAHHHSAAPAHGTPTAQAGGHAGAGAGGHGASGAGGGASGSGGTSGAPANGSGAAGAGSAGHHGKALAKAGGAGKAWAHRHRHRHNWFGTHAGAKTTVFGVHKPVAHPAPRPGSGTTPAPGHASYGYAPPAHGAPPAYSTSFPSAGHGYSQSSGGYTTPGQHGYGAPAYAGAPAPGQWSPYGAGAGMGRGSTPATAAHGGSKPAATKSSATKAPTHKAPTHKAPTRPTTPRHVTTTPARTPTTTTPAQTTTTTASTGTTTTTASTTTTTPTSQTTTTPVTRQPFIITTAQSVTDAATTESQAATTSTGDTATPGS